MSKLIYLSSLRESSIKVAQDNHRRRITEDGIYTPEQIEEFVQDLLDQKVVDLQDSLDADLYTALVVEAMGVSESFVAPLYSLQDTCDNDKEIELMFFPNLREWLVDFWVENPDEDMTDEEHEDLITLINNTKDITELNYMLLGIGYYAEEVL